MNGIYDQEPELDFAAVRCVDAWRRLQSCRQVGMDVGAIPSTAVYAWCEVQGFDREATLLMDRVIQRLDGDWLEARAAERRAEEMRRKREGK